MKTRLSLIVSLLFLAGSLMSTWFLLANLQKIEPALLAFLVLCLIGAPLLLSVYAPSKLMAAKLYVLRLVNRKHAVFIITLVVIALGIGARLFFRVRFGYAPVSDPVTFFGSAEAIASGVGQQGNSYVAFQPYLSAYNNLLGIAMRLISDHWLATILLNTLFDVLSSVIVYVLLKKMVTKSTLIPVIGLAVWLLNPLNIIFSVLSLPIIVVNFFVILTILAGYLLLKQLKYGLNGKMLISAILFGIAVGVGNMFRPVFVVVLIALAMTALFMYLTTSRNSAFLRASTASLVISSLLFVIIQALNTSFVTRQTGLQAAKNPSGWSMYVGSTFETSGEWRPYHNDEMQAICASSLEEKNFDDCHDKLRSSAVHRYMDLGIGKLGSLFIHKLYHQAERQGYFYNAEHSIVGYTTSKTFRLINAYMALYTLFLFGLSAVSLFRISLKTKLGISDPFTIFMALIMIGWFISFVLVESAPRYSTIMYPFLIIFSLLVTERSLSKKIAKK